MLSRKWRWLVGGLAVLALSPVLLVGGLCVLFMPPVGYLDFFENRDRYEQIVQDMKARPPGDAQHVDVASFGEIVAAARRYDDGRYAISLRVFDGGHAGISGYLYSDRPLTLNQGDSFAADEGLGFGWRIARKMAPQWWSIHDGMD